MDNVVVYTNKDGTIGVLSAPDNGRKGLKFDNEGSPTELESEKTYLIRMARSAIPRGISWSIVPKSKIPNDRTFRGAWGADLKNKKILLNKNKARDIILTTARKERDKKLKELDGPELRALGQNNNTELEKIRKVKQELRDLPELITNDIRIKSNNLEKYKVKFPT